MLLVEMLKLKVKRNHFYGQLLGILLLLFTCCSITAQNCKGISTSKAENGDWTRSSAIVPSVDFWSLMMEKKIYDTHNTRHPQYLLTFVIPTRVDFTDSALTVDGNLVVDLTNGEKLDWQVDTCYLASLLGGDVVCFEAPVQTDEFAKLSKHGIVSIEAYWGFRTKFSKERQRQQMKLADCLLNKH